MTRLLAALLTALTGLLVLLTTLTGLLALLTRFLPRLLILLTGILPGLVVTLLTTLSRLLALLARLFLRATLLRLRFILIVHVRSPRAGSPLGQFEAGILVPDMRSRDAGGVAMLHPVIESDDENINRT